jgi:biopolymer transport protein ExbD
MKIKRLKKSKKAKIEIIPMIDVMFFLLATFILASLSMQHFNGIAVDLTKGKASQIKLDEKITLTINQENQVFLNKNKTEIENLANQLKPLLENKEKIIIILADKNSKQGVVTQAMLEAKKAGAQHFSLVVKSGAK